MSFAMRVEYLALWHSGTNELAFATGVACPNMLSHRTTFMASVRFRDAPKLQRQDNIQGCHRHSNIVLGHFF